MEAYVIIIITNSNYSIIIDVIFIIISTKYWSTCLTTTTQIEVARSPSGYHPE